MIRIWATERRVRIQIGPMPGILLSAGNADTMIADAAAVCTATVTT